MSEELDRRIAEEVMGEAEPLHEALTPRVGRSLGGNWLRSFMKDADEYIGPWKPLPFSTDLGTAMRVWEQHRTRFKEVRGFSVELVINHDPEWEIPFVARTGYTPSRVGAGPTLLEAICNLLLALGGEGK